MNIKIFMKQYLVEMRYCMTYYFNFFTSKIINK